MVYEVLPREFFADLNGLQIIKENVSFNWSKEKNETNWISWCWNLVS
jgi:hypothetical protein